MKIYFIENENPARNSSGGIMSYLVNLATFLKNKEFYTILVGNGILLQNKYFDEYFPVTRKNDISNLKYLFSLFLKKKSINIMKGSIIHSQRPDMLVPLIFYGKIKKCNLLCTLHGAHDIAVFDKKGFFHGIFYTILQTIAFYFVDALIAVDDGTKQHFIKKYPWIKRKITVIPIGVNTKKFFPMDKEKLRKKFGYKNNDIILIFVGRLEKEKNIRFIIDSFKIVKKTLINAHLLLVGRGSEENFLKKYVKYNNISDVNFLGEINNDLVPQYLNIADLFLFASLYEGSPTVIKESIACNIPVVSVDVGDVKRVISKLPGCYITDYNVSKFAKKILLSIKERPYDYSFYTKTIAMENSFNKTVEIYNQLRRDKL